MNIKKIKTNEMTAMRWRKKRRATIQNWLSGWLLSVAAPLVGIELAAVVIEPLRLQT
jgi:hypothetical protein